MAHARGKDVSEIGEMDPEDVLEWAAWLEGYGPERQADYRTGLLATVIRNSLVPGAKMTPEDYFPRLRPEPEHLKTEADLERDLAARSAASSKRRQ